MNNLNRKLIHLTTGLALIAEGIVLGTQEEGLVLIDNMDILHPALFENSSIPWYTDLKLGLMQAKEHKQGVIAIILGMKNCPWSEKFLQEILNQNAFIDELAEQFVFYKNELWNLSDEEKAMFQLSPLKEVPLIVLFSSEGKEIARVGYLPETPEVFARKIKHIFQVYTELENKLKIKALSDLSDRELEEMYLEAKEACLHVKDKLLEVGHLRKKSLFFLMETYADKLLQGKRKEKATKEIKQIIESLDPKNTKGSKRKIAILEFEEAIRSKKKGGGPLKNIKPLLEYIKAYKSLDKDHIWELEMMIAQYLFSKNKIEPALEHAKASLHVAPDSAKAEIEASIDYLQKLIK